MDFNIWRRFVEAMPHRGEAIMAQDKAPAAFHTDRYAPPVQPVDSTAPRMQAMEIGSGALLWCSCQELCTGSDDEGDHVIRSLERVCSFNRVPEIRAVDVILDSKVALPSIA
jgi:hypothetical protein